MVVVVAWVQTAATSGFFGSDEFRNALWTIGVALIGFSSRQLYCLRDDVRDLMRDMRGHGAGEGLIATVARHEARLDVIEDWKIALDAVAEVERREHAGPDRRVGPRRKLDVAHEVLDERVRRITDEHSTEDPRL